MDYRTYLLGLLLISVISAGCINIYMNDGDNETATTTSIIVSTSQAPEATSTTSTPATSTTSSTSTTSTTIEVEPPKEPGPEIVFVDPTPADGATVPRDSATIKANIISGKTDSVTFSLDGRDYLVYDGDTELYMNMDNNKDIYEGGLLVVDSSANRHSGDRVSASWTSFGKYEGAISFQGSGSCLLVEDIDIGPAFTLMAWINPTSINPNGYLLGKRSGMQGGYSVLWDTAGANGRIKCGFSADGTQGDWIDPPTATTPLQLNKWSHVACVYDGSHVTYYLNGAEDGSYPKSGTPYKSNEILSIGCLHPNTATSMRGTMDEVAIINRALTPDEIRFMYGSHFKRTDLKTLTFETNMEEMSRGEHTYNLRATDTNGNEGFAGDGEGRTIVLT